MPAHSVESTAVRGVTARAVLDSRGNPTVEVDVVPPTDPWAAPPSPPAPPPAPAKRWSCTTATLGVGTAGVSTGPWPT